MPSLRPRVGTQSKEAEEVSTMSEPTLEERESEETEGEDAACGGGRADAHRSIRGSSPTPLQPTRIRRTSSPLYLVWSSHHRSRSLLYHACSARQKSGCVD